jgi:hypothetical protein
MSEGEIFTILLSSLNLNQALLFQFLVKFSLPKTIVESHTQGHQELSDDSSPRLCYCSSLSNLALAVPNPPQGPPTLLLSYLLPTPLRYISHLLSLTLNSTPRHLTSIRQRSEPHSYNYHTLPQVTQQDHSRTYIQQEPSGCLWFGMIRRMPRYIHILFPPSSWNCKAQANPSQLLPAIITMTTTKLNHAAIAEFMGPGTSSLI